MNTMTQSARTVRANSMAIIAKKYAYLIALLPVTVLLPGSYAGMFYLGYENLWAFFSVFFVFGVIPVLDHIVGTDSVNPDEKLDVPAMGQEKWYPFLTLLAVPLQIGSIFFGGWVFMNVDFNIVGQIGWMLSVGVVGGITAINLGHELVHKDSKIEQWAGGLMLASVTYAGFKVEHVRGHHVHVSTPEDASSSRYNQTLYQFLPQAFYRNFVNAFRLEAQRLKRKGKSPFSLKNELIWWYGISALFAVAFFLVWGWMGVLFFVGQSFFAAAELEVINYIEHYGLHRRKLENGRYERTDVHHSWNSNYLLTNLFLFQLQRHSDHHAYPKRRYQVLRHHDESPQMPSGYAGMVVLAIFPPLWFKVMNPKVEAYYAGEEHQLES